jgi:XTP/dITP diphosphohydrolase
MEIVLATGNPHKIEEMNAIFDELMGGAVRFMSLKDTAASAGLVGYEEPAETGSTFDANATIKALSYAAQTGRVCLADDSGLEIDALGGRPGVISSHYCTDGREVGMSRSERDAANNARVLWEMEGVEEDRRGARFVCVMVLGAPMPSGKGRCSRGTGLFRPSLDDGLTCAKLLSSRGVFEGRIGRGERGAGGFGYDPLFMVGPDFRISAAELTADEKNARSHRGAAARELARGLRELGLGELGSG